MSLVPAKTNEEEATDKHVKVKKSVNKKKNETPAKAPSSSSKGKASDTRFEPLIE